MKINKKISKATGISEKNIKSIGLILGALAFGVTCRKLGEF